MGASGLEWDALMRSNLHAVALGDTLQRAGLRRSGLDRIQG